jgi:hypothetical protein
VSNTTQTLTNTWRVVSLVTLTTACASSQLEIPTNHPGHPAARVGKASTTTTLGPIQAPAEPAAVERSPHAGHDEHGHHGAGSEHATYVCPMHPEVVSKEPGKCPICGMKLEPKKGGE